MDDCPEVELKKLCCTCLSRDRKLFQLCRLPDGVNNLYLLLSFDSEAYREGFYKDTASLYICWECRAVMCRITRFRKQACTAQRELTSIADGRTHIQTASLSRLTTHHTTRYQKVISESNTTSTDNFIDCGLTTNIKSESEEDIPLSELHGNWLSDNETEVVIPTIEFKDELSNSKEELSISKDTIDCKEDLLYKFKKKRKKKKYGFSTVLMTDGEFEEIRNSNRIAVDFVEALFKCESCIVTFGSQEELDEHNSSLHVEKPDHLQCDICLVYTNITTYHDHREAHYHRHICQYCVYTACIVNDMLAHLRSGHAVKDLCLPGKRKKTRHKTVEDLNPGSKPRRKPSMLDKRTPYGYLCSECNKYFDNKNQRWKHVQRHHREGYKCATCGKRFAFKNNLTRHEQLHLGPPPREECPVCHKMIRSDLLKVHSRIHSDRQRFSCAACTKCFVSRASYEHHLKYTQAHAQTDLHKYKCTMCDKGYRSRGELRDHVNYQHMGKTQHKCPVCGKALATRRCVTRHMRRAHDGVKESARDKICQQCGKAFRDKKGLREHELIHTGERPLSCEICGCTFRQSASLYTHRKRVHKIYTSAKKYSEPIDRHLHHLEGVMAALRGRRIVICADANTHSPMWHSAPRHYTGRGHTAEYRRVALEAFIAAHGLTVINEEGQPLTFSGPNGESNIDITLTTRNVTAGCWRVHSDASTSDHRLITFQVSATGGHHGAEPGREPVRFRDQGVDWPHFRQTIHARMGRFDLAGV